jgi:ketosteroid isomerase-like protein
VNEDQTRAIVRELYDAYARGDMERIKAAIHDDIDWVMYAPVGIFPFAGPRRGRAAVLNVLAAIGELYRMESYKLEILVVEGDRAAVMSDISFIQLATNRTMRFRVANFLRYRNGQLIEFREFTNTFDVAEQVLGRELPL